MKHPVYIKSYKPNQNVSTNCMISQSKTVVDLAIENSSL